MDELAPGGAAVTEEDWDAARSRNRRSAYMSCVIGITVGPLVGLLALYLTGLFATGGVRYAVLGLWMAVLVAPIVIVLSLRGVKEQEKSDRVIAALAAQFESQARGQKFESRLANALDMAEGEPEVVQVIERSFSTIVPDAPIELLLADNSHAHLLRMASASPSGTPPACCVDSPDHCPAARRAQVQRFSDSDELDACPKLRGRPEGAVSAMCVPVSIMGRSVGVIHVTGEQHTSFSENIEQDLATLAKLSGARIGLLRVMAETQLQATTDNLTGLLNRRSFENRFSTLRHDEPDMAIAMADLDHFKVLNDTYGHETGDRALRLFAQVLRESLRAQDIVCRHGGEEFAIAVPGCSLEKAREIFDGARIRLDAAMAVARLPKFTVSFGVVGSDPSDDLPTLISRADAALFQAKRQGRDCVVVFDPLGHEVSAPTGLSESLATAMDEYSMDGMRQSYRRRSRPSAFPHGALKSLVTR
jgi:diguanylate cyclase (GGDEF)-like protein